MERTPHTSVIFVSIGLKSQWLIDAIISYRIYYYTTHRGSQTITWHGVGIYLECQCTSVNFHCTCYVFLVFVLLWLHASLVILIMLVQHTCLLFFFSPPFFLPLSLHADDTYICKLIVTSCIIQYQTCSCQLWPPYESWVNNNNHHQWALTE